MAYKYQQNLLGSASKGYVKYNIIPDFGTILKAGQTVQISGQMYFRDKKTYGIGVSASTSSSAFTELALAQITASRGVVTSFSLEFTLEQSFINRGSTRLFTSLLRFGLYDTEDLSSASNTDTVSAQAMSLIKTALPPSVSNITLSDETGALEHFGEAVQNKSRLVLEFDCSLDPLIPGNAVASVDVFFSGTTAIPLPTESVTVENGHVTAKLKPVAFTQDTLKYISFTVKDLMGSAFSESTTQAIRVYPYHSPTITAIDGKRIARRYDYATDDYGNQTEVFTSEGRFVALTFRVDVADVRLEGAIVGSANKGNHWEAHVMYALDGTDEWVAAGAIGGVWLGVADYIENKYIIPKSVVFDAGLKYNLRITLTDFFETTVLLGEIDKANAYFNVTKYGVAANMISTATAVENKNEFLYPVYPYQGIVGLTYLKKDYEQKAGVSPDGKQLYTKTLSVDVTAGSAASAPIERLGSVYRLDGVLVSSNQTTWPINFYLNENNHCACYRPGSARSVTVASAGMSGKAFVTVLYAKADTDDPEAVYLWNNAPIPGYDWQSNGYKRPHFTGNAVGVVESNLLRIKLPAVTGSNSIPYSAHLNTTDIVAVPSGLTRFNILAKKTSTTPTYLDFGLIASNAANSYSTENGGQMSGDITLTEVETVYTIDLSAETISNANLKCVINGKANLKNLVPTAGVEVYALWFD